LVVVVVVLLLLLVLVNLVVLAVLLVLLLLQLYQLTSFSASSFPEPPPLYPPSTVLICIFTLMSNQLEYADGSTDVFACRERPHIIQNKAGDIIALTNGAARITCHDSSKKNPQDYAFTLLQPVGGK
jgi:hypothetical protein